VILLFGGFRFALPTLHLMNVYMNNIRICFIGDSYVQPA